MNQIRTKLEEWYDSFNRNMIKVSVYVDTSLNHGFTNLGYFVAKRPGVVICSVLLVTALCAVGFTQFDQESNAESLFTSQDADSFKDKQYVESVWGYDPKPGTVYSKADNDIISRESLLEMMNIYDLIWSTSIEHKGDTYSFATICVKPDQVNCQISSILDLWNNSRTAIEDDSDILATVNAGGTTAFGRIFTSDELLGGISYSGSDITSAKASVIAFFLENNKVDDGSEFYDPVARKWELALASDIQDLNDDQNTIESFLITNDVISDEASKAINSDISLIVAGYFLLIIYGVFVMSKPNWVRSHGSLAVMSIVSILLSVISAFGFSMGVGFKYNVVVQSLILVLLGLGMDDSFVIVHSLMRQSRTLPVEERVATALGKAGSSITITSVTDMVAFITGTFSSLPALEIFSTYAVFGIGFLFLYQITFFVACMVLDVRREEQNRADFLCCRSIPEEEQDLNCIRPQKTFSDDQKSYTQIVVGDYLPDFILHPVGKAVILLTAAILFGFGLNGALKIEINFEYEWFVPDNSYIQEGFDIRDTYFDQSVFPVRLYTKEGDYFTFQDQLKDLGDQLIALDSIRDDSVDNWYTSYLEWLSSSSHSGELDGQGRPANEADFYEFLVEFLDESEGSRYLDAIKFTDGTKTEISASRIFGLFEGLNNAHKQVGAFKDSRRVAEEYGDAFDSIAYSFVFLFWEGYTTIEWETIRNLISAGIAVFFVCLILLASIRGSFLVFIVIVLVDINLLGFAYYSGYYYNSVTTINLILAVGLAVDYSAHICHSFLSAEGTKAERVRKALEEIGPSVINGGTTTFLAVLPLVLSASFIFQVFFAMFAYIVAFGLFHGVLFLPVLLSLVGPPSYKEHSATLRNMDTELTTNH